MPGKLELGGAGWRCRWGIDYRRWRRFCGNGVTVRLWRLRQRAHERDEARDLLHSHGTGKGRAFCKKPGGRGYSHIPGTMPTLVCLIHETQNDRGSGRFMHIVQGWARV